MKKILFLLVICLTAHISHAQQMVFYPSTQPRALGMLNDTLANAFCGGITNPIFSNIDLNGDGRQDIFIFDKQDGRIMTFLSIKTKDSVKLVYAPMYEQAFPKMRYWAFLQDFNGDGKQDIFTHGSPLGFSSGMVVYKNISTPGNLKFELFKSPLMRETSAGSGQLTVNEVELPTFADIDNDGDLDILKFDNFFNTTVWYYNNRSRDMYGHSDSLVFWLYDQCWGRFEEPEGAGTVNLGITCNQNLVKRQKEGKHAGSTMLAFDQDNDGDADLVIGDTEKPGLSFLENGRKRSGQTALQTDSIYSVNYKFPFSKASDIMGMVLPSLVELNNDGHKDLLLSPMDIESKRKNMVWFYHNISKSNSYFFQYKKNNFLEESMLDWGINSMPCFFYYNNDSLPDLLVSYLGEFDGRDTDHIVLYLNVGTKSKAVFKPTDNDFMLYSTSKRGVLAPAAGDIDGDGKEDLVIGNNLGTLYFHKKSVNGSTVSYEWPGMPLQEDINGNLQNIDVGNNSLPSIADLNRDGKADLVVGSSNGNLAHYRNISSGGVIKFEKVTDTLLLFANEQRLSATFNNWDNNDTLDMLVATQNGQMLLYMNVFDGKQLTQPIKNIIHNFNTNTTETAAFGKGLIVTSAKIDQDNSPDILVGNMRGGVYFFGSKNNGQQMPVNITKTTAPQLSFKIYPNPAQNNLNLQIEGIFESGHIWAEIKDVTGKTLFTHNFMAAPGQNINEKIQLQNMANGFYFVQLTTANGKNSGVQKLIINR